MAHQPTPSTDAVQDRTTEKIILSGSPFISSMFGKDQGITAAAVPAFHRDPIITGPDVIGEPVAPPLLTCEAQSFASSPRATLAYQWKRDTVNITDATNETYVTVTADIGTTVTCEVTITNPSGSDTGLSNGIAITALVPSFVGELDVMTLTGMNDPVRATVNGGDICIILGIEHYMKIDINEADLYAASGVAAPPKVDLNEESLNVLTGMTGDTKIDVDEADAYAMFLPTILTPLVVVNGDAENSVMTDWTMDTNTVTSETTAPGYSTSYREGLRFFVPEQLGQGVDSQMHQVIDIPAGDYTDVDTGLCYCVARFIHMSDEGYDKLVVTLDALDAGDAVLETTVYSPDPGPTNEWMRDSTVEDPLNLPTLTRKVKLTVLFDAHASSGSAVNSVYADAFTIELMKTA